MPEVVDIKISDLLLDVENPRYPEVVRNQQVAATALAEKHPTHVLKLAADVVEKGLDPTTLPAVVASVGLTRFRGHLTSWERSAPGRSQSATNQTAVPAGVSR